MIDDPPCFLFIRSAAEHHGAETNWADFQAGVPQSAFIGDIDFHKKLSMVLFMAGFLIRQEKDKHFESKPSLATRQCSMAAIEKISAFLPELIGGSADLSGSNNTKTNNSKIINSKNFNGNYIHYGVREHGMAAVMNGLALYGGIIPYGGTFLIFSDYCKPSIRLSALMGLKVIYVFSHDSIGLGEDGPTHQPIEQLTGLRAIPNLNVFRPADINETFECWEIALKSENTPSAIALSRQKVPYINPSNSKENKCEKGAYVINLTSHESNVTLVASGTEVELALKVQDKLKENNIHSKVVSMPCMELFDKQPEDYRKDILEENSLIITIEAGSVMSWQKYIKNKGANLGEINFFPDDLEIKDQKIILRLDLNVPIKDKVIKDDTRITLCLPFINRLIEKKAKIIIISHLGRPKGINVPDLSLIPIYKYLKDALKTNVYFFRGTFDGETKEKFSHLKGGEVILIENIRFFKEETEDGQDFSKKLGELGDIYINDAFSCSHRKQASVHSITKFVKKSYAGPLLKKEITAINLVIKNKKEPVW